jgi:hypothetical protein
MRTNAWEEIEKDLKIKRKTWRELAWREDSVSPALIASRNNWLWLRHLKIHHRYDISLALLLAPLDLLVMQGIHFDSQPFQDEMDLWSLGNDPDKISSVL